MRSRWRRCMMQVVLMGRFVAYSHSSAQHAYRLQSVANNHPPVWTLGLEVKCSSDLGIAIVCGESHSNVNKKKKTFSIGLYLMWCLSRCSKKCIANKRTNYTRCSPCHCNAWLRFYSAARLHLVRSDADCTASAQRHKSGEGKVGRLFISSSKIMNLTLQMIPERNLSKYVKEPSRWQVFIILAVHKQK